MYKQVFPSPLKSKARHLQCGHNAFTHHIFPRLVYKNGMTIIEELETSPSSAADFLEWALSLTNEALPVGDEHAKLYLRDISVTLDGVHEASLVILTLTKPEETIGAYFIGLLAPVLPPSAPQRVIRYFTLERTDSKGTALCERIAEGEDRFSHRFLSIGPKPTEKAFTEVITNFLDLDSAMRGN